MVLLLLLLAAMGSALQMNVPASEPECIYEFVDANNKLKGSFEVLAGGLLDIDAEVVGPDGHMLWEARRRSDAHFNLLAPKSGEYKLCFSNTISTAVEKTVAFNLHLGDTLFQEIAQHDHITRLEDEIMELADNIEQVQDAQKYYWARERASRDTNESTNARVLWYSILETLILVSLSAWQIWELMRFFGTSLTR